MADQPFKKANVILVQTPDSPAVALRNLARVLVQQGYTIQRLDEQMGTLRTDPRSLPKGFSPTLTIVALATKSGTLALRGEFVIDAATLGRVSYTTEFVGMENAANKLTFREVEKAAKAYPGGRVQYSLQ
ncbi:hypothetical protein GCM10027048_27680 [Hymenobacter coalescens]